MSKDQELMKRVMDIREHLQDAKDDVTRASGALEEIDASLKKEHGITPDKLEVTISQLEQERRRAAANLEKQLDQIESQIEEAE